MENRQKTNQVKEMDAIESVFDGCLRGDIDIESMVRSLEVEGVEWEDIHDRVREINSSYRDRLFEDRVVRVVDGVKVVVCRGHGAINNGIPLLNDMASFCSSAVYGRLLSRGYSIKLCGGRSVLFVQSVNEEIVNKCLSGLVGECWKFPVTGGYIALVHSSQLIDEGVSEGLREQEINFG